MSLIHPFLAVCWTTTLCALGPKNYLKSFSKRNTFTWMELSKFVRNHLCYYILYTICSFHHDNNVGYEDNLNKRLIPGMYCLLSGKSQVVYERLFQLIIDKAHLKNYNIAWEQSMSDFEHSIISAITAKFPNVTQRGCHFHFCQALFRRIQRNMTFLTLINLLGFI